MAETSIALNRFGLGARPGDVMPADARSWLLVQLDAFDPRPPAIAAAPTSMTVAAQLAAYGETAPTMMVVKAEALPGLPGDKIAPANAADRTPTPARAARLAALAEQRAGYSAAVGARTTVALASTTPFVERLVHFWANHFAVSAEALKTIGMTGTLEFEAVRPHVLGRFGDMMMAVERHPAMLLYLDQAGSVGPTSIAGARVAARGGRLGLNENFAREIMELHTLGVGAGYTQGDVTELARALTGWTVARIGSGRGNAMTGSQRPGSFAFLPVLHEPGDRIVMGRRYPAGGAEQAAAVLRDLAVHPATARHIATKLARHFAGDTPPPALVTRLEAAFNRSGGDLPTVYRALIASPEPWIAAPVKFKTPWEWALSSYRAIGMRDAAGPAVIGLLTQLGQPVWRPGQPSGYDDIAAGWAGPDAVMRRVEAAERLAGRAATAVDARALAPALFPGALSDATARALAGAESPGQALALLLVAPESLRR